MGVIKTNKWLEDNFYEPTTICAHFQSAFDGDKPQNIYRYLMRFGMYKPSRHSRQAFEKMKEQDTWNKLERIFSKYKKKWKGPDIPIYVFPFQSSWRGEENKSGVSFPDQLFLFIGDVENEKELEALFIHEYHHVCRIHYQKKAIEDYTLLDSIIMEGLAELAVKENCGEAYNATWCHLYDEEEIKQFWETELKEYLHVKKTEEKHDDLLYGYRRYPRLIGYNTGFYLVNSLHSKQKILEKDHFTIKSEAFL
ncbi:DUF2268 domain-containing putative Zn-dependent protease [Niallia circulans]|uniref:DUF2268 domain-containing protein n=1 Tax=Niallia circulans TaxID=1397 RepID=UPI001F2A8822|nr:DUF2268 domain-containing putative Zn-dependent protease [Niallia circulans]